MVAEAAQAVGIGNAGGIGRRGLALGGRAVDGDLTGGGAVDVGDWPHAGAGELLMGATTVGVADLHGNVLANIGIGQHIAAAGCARDGHAIAQPLVAEAAQAVGIGDP